MVDIANNTSTEDPVNTDNKKATAIHSSNLLESGMIEEIEVIEVTDEKEERLGIMDTATIAKDKVVVFQQKKNKK